MGWFYKLLKKEEFLPTRLGMFVNSSYLIRRALGQAVAKHCGEMRGTMLDFGCGTAPYRQLFKIDHYLGLEIDSPGYPLKNAHSTLLYSGGLIPLENESVDSILMTEVLEHVFNPAQVLAEFHRILRPGGCILITCPFAWPLHEEPYDYALHPICVAAPCSNQWFRGEVYREIWQLDTLADSASSDLQRAESPSAGGPSESGGQDHLLHHPESPCPSAEFFPTQG
jgi:SAM-dependent methyltransferase